MQIQAPQMWTPSATPVNRAQGDGLRRAAMTARLRRHDSDVQVHHRVHGPPVFVENSPVAHTMRLSEVEPRSEHRHDDRSSAAGGGIIIPPTERVSSTTAHVV